jgi:signal transduction histidine kinase
MMDDVTDTRCEQNASRTMWERSKVGWHIATYGLLAVIAVSLLAVDDVSERERWIGLALVVILTASYTVLGRPALGEERLAFAVPHLVITWAGFFWLTSLSDVGYILLFSLFPQVWALLPTRFAIAVTALGVLGLVLIQSARAGWTVDALVGAGLGGLVSLVISVLLGLWITGLMQESDRRAVLIAELEHTRAELAAAEHDRGVLSERERLAHEIHDTLAQGFASIIALAQAAEAAVDTHPEAARDRILLIERTARDNLAEARALVTSLAPVDLVGATLAQALQRVVARFQREAGVSAQLRVTGTPHILGSATEVVMLRAAQEALTNVRRHAQAGRVLMTLAYRADGAALEVSDDGRGFDPEHADGFGLRGMRSRVEQAGGELELSAGPEHGTTLRLRVPASVGAPE